MTELTEPEICRTIIAFIDGQTTRLLTYEQAAQAAQKLVAFYPVKAFNDPETFMEGAAANFEGRDINIVRRVLDPKVGIPARQKFAPAIAEIKEALDEAERHRFKIRATAQWMIDERERRRAAAEDAAWDYSPEAVEKRKALVAALGLGNKP